ncbi:MAG: Flp pilus assembly complex ATPase component TadA [Acidobacteria bacterium]|nr:Flp pilus assembly complex ATPase component TadA [Acidobacteriota bacterium]
MSLIPSLLQAIVQVDGEALVMHAGDKPYVVTPSGQVDLASRGLTLDAVNGIVSQLLPVEVMHALDEFGAAQYQLPVRPDFPQEQFTVVAARGGDDLWAEIRRRRIPDEDVVPESVFGPAATRGTGRHRAAMEAPAPDERALATPAGASDDTDAIGHEMFTSGPESAPSGPMVEHDDLRIPDADHLWNRKAPEPAVARAEPIEKIAADEPELARPAAASSPARRVHEVQPPTPAAKPVPTPPAAAKPAAPVLSPHRIAAPPPQPAVVLPMARSPIRPEAPAAVTGQIGAAIDRLLRLAAARGASTLYLAAGSRPSVRVDGENQPLEGEAVLAAYDVESLLLALMPERSHEALRSGVATEWICDLEDVGRVRCMSLSDQHGPGGVFRLMPVRAVSAEQLALPREIQSLAIEPEGLLLVVGPRSSGKRTLISAFIDLINRTRRDHVISIETEINIVHERGTSFVSQREVRGGNEEVLAAARAALREDPDVLAIEDLRTGDLMNVALEAAASGRLVIGGFPAHSATSAIDRIIDLYAPQYRRQIQMALAEQIRGVVVQVLVRKHGGGRIAARELLLNTPAVASLIADGKTSQLPMAIEGGRRYGMAPLNDALVGYVQSGAVDAHEAYRRAADRAGFVSLLKRQGIDTSSIERLA